MNLSGELLRVYVPDFVRRSALRELFDATAYSFGVSRPAVGGSSADEMLERYAAFTAKRAAAALRTHTDLAQVRQRLFDSAHTIGSRLRRELKITSTRDAMAVARALYGMLRIDFRQTSEGGVRIARCYFSRFYSPAVCQLMSSLDQGLVAGLSGGGKLEFRQRITEGAPWCSASFAEAPS